MMPETRIAIAGLGAIGRTVARRLAEGIPGLTLACAAARDVAKAKAWLDKAKISCPLVELAEFPRYADLAVECAPAEILESICTPMLTAGKRVMVQAPAPCCRGLICSISRASMAARSSCRPGRCSASTPLRPRPRASSVQSA